VTLNHFFKFCQDLQAISMDNLLGIDYGNKNIGLALAPKSLMALGFQVLPNDKNFFEKLEVIIKEHAISKIIIGFPLNMDGTESTQTTTTENFCAQLKAKFSQVSIIRYDERLSTVEAKKNLTGKKNYDAEAARIILQGYLDASKYQTNKNK